MPKRFVSFIAVLSTATVVGSPGE